MDVAEATLSRSGSIVVWLKPEEMSANCGDVAEARLAAIEAVILAVRTAGVQRGLGSSRVLRNDTAPGRTLGWTERPTMLDTRMVTLAGQETLIGSWRALARPSAGA